MGFAEWELGLSDATTLGAEAGSEDESGFGGSFGLYCDGDGLL